MKKIIDRKKPIALKEAEVVINAPEYEEQKQQVISRINTLLGIQDYNALGGYVNNMSYVLSITNITPMDYVRMLVYEVQYGSHLIDNTESEQPADLVDKTVSFMVEKMAQDIVDTLRANDYFDDALPFESKKRNSKTIATFEEFTSKKELTNSKI